MGVGITGGDWWGTGRNCWKLGRTGGILEELVGTGRDWWKLLGNWWELVRTGGSGQELVGSGGNWEELVVMQVVNKLNHKFHLKNKLFKKKHFFKKSIARAVRKSHRQNKTGQTRHDERLITWDEFQAI